MGQNAKEIVRKADDKLRGETSQQEMSIKIVRPDWTRTMSTKLWNKGEEYAMILITAPAKEAGNAFLKRKEEMWHWVPRIQRTVKMPPSMMMQSWMGTDFTNDDLVKQASMVEDYNHTLVGDSTIRGHECYKIKMVPKPEAAVVWGKVNIFITKDKYQQLRLEYYEEGGKLVNVLRGYDIKNLGGRQLPSKMAMNPVNKEGNKTIIEYEAIEFGIDFPEGFFSVRKMKKLR